MCFRLTLYVYVWRRKSPSWTRKPSSCRTWRRRRVLSPEKSGTWRTCLRSKKERLMSCRKRWEWKERRPHHVETLGRKYTLATILACPHYSAFELLFIFFVYNTLYCGGMSNYSRFSHKFEMNSDCVGCFVTFPCPGLNQSLCGNIKLGGYSVHEVWESLMLSGENAHRKTSKKIFLPHWLSFVCAINTHRVLLHIAPRPALPFCFSSLVSDHTPPSLSLSLIFALLSVSSFLLIMNHCFLLSYHK